MGDRSDIANDRHFESGCLERSNRRFASRTGTFHEHFNFPETKVVCLFGCRFCRDLSRKGSVLSRAFESVFSSRRPRDRVSVRVRNGDDHIVKCRFDERFTVHINVNFLFLFCCGRWRRLLFCHGLTFQTNYFLAIAFFLPATVLRFPLRVREFVRVRCPRTGKPLR